MTPEPRFVAPDVIRADFATAMSAMYRDEVPAYGDLVRLVETVNAQVLADQAGAVTAEDASRLNAERHGAIRVGAGSELRALAKAFAVMGMEPVGYYDLSVAGLPVHSTAFRPVTRAALAASPFRVFTSLLRPQAMTDAAIRSAAEAAIAQRTIITPDAQALIDQAERDGGLIPADADAFVSEILETFRWHGRATVDFSTYETLSNTHRLIADIVCFPGPHINHLTPRVLDIDAAQARMPDYGMAPKAIVEGPPRRACPILLRQTAFQALNEPVRFASPNGQITEGHTARFGEIEARGAALTPKGRALYDRLLTQARTVSAGDDNAYEPALKAAFAAFPDDWATLKADNLAYFRTVRREGGETIEPITYEDFLPVSAAGIFRSNLAGVSEAAASLGPDHAGFEAALGRRVHDPFRLYAAEAAA